MNSLKEQFMILPALSLYYLVTEYIISVNKAEGRSMEPTIKSNEVIIVNRFFRKVLKNDIIIAQSPLKPNLDICKRVIYLAGETVPDYGLIVPINHVWIEGDNKQESFDSRQYGPVPIQLLTGKVKFIPFEWTFL